MNTGKLESSETGSPLSHDRRGDAHPTGAAGPSSDSSTAWSSATASGRCTPTRT